MSNSDFSAVSKSLWWKNFRSFANAFWLSYVSVFPRQKKKLHCIFNHDRISARVHLSFLQALFLQINKSAFPLQFSSIFFDNFLFLYIYWDGGEGVGQWREMGWEGV